MIEIVIAFIIWGLVCYRIGYIRGAKRGAEIGVETTMIIVSQVVSVGEIIKIITLAKQTEDRIKTKTGQ